MNKSLALTIGSMLLTTAACSAAPSDKDVGTGEDVASSDDALTSGSSSSTTKAVGLVRRGTKSCSAVLIGSKTVLSSRACLAGLPTTASLCFVVPGKVERAFCGGSIISSATQAVALVSLNAPVDGDILPLAIATNASLADESRIQIYGFGSGKGKKASTRINNVTATEFNYAGLPNLQVGGATGFTDLGGPTLLKGDPWHTVVGIHTRTGYSTAGVLGFDARVDAASSWIEAQAGDDLVKRCIGDCNADGVVTTTELNTVIAISNGKKSAGSCRAADGDMDGKVSWTEVDLAAANSENGCFQ